MKYIWYIIVLGVTFFFITHVTNMLSFFCSNSESTEYYQIYGILGDYVGGVIGTVVSFITLVLIYITYINQKNELNIQKELTRQQQFETTFFNLLNYHNDLKSKFFLDESRSIFYNHLTNYEILYFKTFQNYPGLDDPILLEARQEKLSSNKRTGVNVFEVIETDFRKLFNVEHLNEKIHTLSSNSIVKQQNQELINRLNELKSAIELYKEQIGQFLNSVNQNSIENLFSGVIVNDLNDSDIDRLVKIEKELIDKAYSLLFDVYKGFLSHYSRSIYRMLKLIKQAEEKNKETDKKDTYRLYADILQSQLNVHEQFLLFYNFIYFDGDSKNEKYWTIKLINHFEFLENLGVDNLVSKNHELFYNFLIKGSDRIIK